MRFGDHHTGGVLVRGEQSQGVSAVHDQRLLICHLAEVFHHQSVLCPVLEHGSIAPIGDELVRVLSHSLVQIVLNHHHDGCCLAAVVRIVVDGSCLHLVAGTQAVHVDAAIAVQLVGKLGQQRCVMLGWEIAQCIAQCQTFLIVGEDVLALGRMVDFGVIWHRLGQHIGYACTDVGHEFFSCHLFKSFMLGSIVSDLASQNYCKLSEVQNEKQSFSIFTSETPRNLCNITAS